MLKETVDRLYGAWWGAFIGDAIAAPTHGYSSVKLLGADYGTINSMVAPKSIHPQSVLFSLPRPELPPEFDYIGEKRRELWSRHGTHPHYGFQAGENTLPLFLALHLTASMIPSGKFDIDAWMSRYQAVMTSPEGHNDTFIPSIHRRYFDNLASGKDPEKNGCPDAHMSDLAIFIPIMFSHLKDPDSTNMNLYHAFRKFTLGEAAYTSAYFLSELLDYVIRGNSIEDSIYQKMTPDRHFCLAFPYRRWIKSSGNDFQAISSTGILAALEESMPLTIYLAIKYGRNFSEALFANANIGGETTGRGAILGMLAGAQCGFSKIPKEFISGLKYNGEIQALGDELYKMVS